MIFVELLSYLMHIYFSWIRYYFCEQWLQHVHYINKIVFVAIRNIRGNWYRSYVNNSTTWDGLQALAVAFPLNLSKYCCIARASNIFWINLFLLKLQYKLVYIESLYLRECRSRIAYLHANRNVFEIKWNSISKFMTFYPDSKRQNLFEWN